MHRVEILPCLVSAAESALPARCRGLVSFRQGDMLGSSLEGVSVVVLASQCWDRALRRRRGPSSGPLLNSHTRRSLHRRAAVVSVLTHPCMCSSRRVGDKLVAELAQGSLVVDYAPALRESEAFGEPVWAGTAPTSWNPRQQFFVFARR